MLRKTQSLSTIPLEWKRKGTRLYKLEMMPKYPDKRDFLDTLVHEMVHLYQMQNLGDTGKGLLK